MSESNPGSRRGSLFSSLFNIPSNSNPVQGTSPTSSSNGVPPNVPHTLFQDIGSIQMNINANLGSNSDSSGNFQHHNNASGSSVGSLNRKGSFLTTALDISQELLLLQQQQQQQLNLQNSTENSMSGHYSQENSSRTLQQQISLDEVYRTHQQQQNSQPRNVNPTINLNLEDGNIPVIHSIQQNKLNISININQTGGNNKNIYGNLVNQNVNINQNINQNNYHMNGGQAQQHRNFQGYEPQQQSDRYQMSDLQDRIAGVINRTPQYRMFFKI